MKTYLVLVLISFAVTGCVSSSDSYQPEFEVAKVVDRMPGFDESPEWANGHKPMYQEKSDIIYISTTSMSGDARPEACTRVAADLGRVQILREIKDNITSSGQIDEISAAEDPSFEALTAYLSQGQLSGTKTVERYWEKKEESDTKGLRILRLHCAAKVSIQRSVLEKQIKAAMGGERQGNAEIRKQLLEAQKGFLDGLHDKKIDEHAGD